MSCMSVYSVSVSVYLYAAAMRTMLYVCHVPGMVYPRVRMSCVSCMYVMCDVRSYVMSCMYMSLYSSVFLLMLDAHEFNNVMSISG